MDFLHIPKQDGAAVLSAGCLLIAEPFLADPGFSRSVVLLCEYGENGSLGFMLNKKTDWVLSDLLPEFIRPAIPVFKGGPVQNDTLHILHRIPELGGVNLGGGLFWGGSFDELQTMISDKGYEPADVKLLLGYSGWSPGQLEKEMEDGSWLIAKADPRILFDEDGGDVWTRAVRSLGKEYEHLVHMPVNPQLN